MTIIFVFICLLLLMICGYEIQKLSYEKQELKTLIKEFLNENEYSPNQLILIERMKKIE